MQGFLSINKPSGVTSAYVVNKVKKRFHIDKIGHMGTLDPLASGVLIIAVGKATRMFDYVLEKTKQYVAVFSFGSETDTLDSDGEVTKTTNIIPTQEQIEYSIRLLTGKQHQMPPLYSAKKVNGKKAYELARENVEFTLKTKEIEIFEFKLLEKISDTDYKFLITCSSGTYIRSIGRDLAYLCNSLGTMTSLVRTQSGIFSLENSSNLEEILNKETLEHDIISIENALNFPKLVLNDVEFKTLINGLKPKIKANDGLYFVKHGEVLVAIGEVSMGVLTMKTFLMEN